MVSVVGKRLTRIDGFAVGDGVKDSAAYLSENCLFVDALGGGAGSPAFLVRSIDPNTNAPTILFRLDKDGLVSLPSVLFPAHANQLVNGGFEVFQRGGTVTADNAYAHDRWQFLKGGTSTIALTDETTIVDTGSGHSMKAAYVHGSAVSYVDQKLEALTQLRGRTLTFSIRVLTTTGGLLRPYLQDSGVRTFGATAVAGGQWQTLSVTAAIGAAATVIRVGVELSGSDTVYLDNAMLVVGSVAQAFTPLPPADEIGRCQRYYHKLGPAATFPHFAGYMAAGVSVVVTLLFPVKMASAPTVTVGGTWAYINGSALAADSITADGCRLTWTATALGNSAAYSNSSGYLEMESNP